MDPLDGNDDEESECSCARNHEGQQRAFWRRCVALFEGKSAYKRILKPAVYSQRCKCVGTPPVPTAVKVVVVAVKEDLIFRFQTRGARVWAITAEPRTVGTEHTWLPWSRLFSTPTFLVLFSRHLNNHGLILNELRILIHLFSAHFLPRVMPALALGIARRAL